jgi:hypothetical protein
MHHFTGTHKIGRVNMDNIYVGVVDGMNTKMYEVMPENI